MPLFNFFRKTTPPAPAIPTTQQIHHQLLTVLIEALQQRGFKAVKHAEYLAVVVNNQIEIAPLVITGADSHPALMHVMFMTAHHHYFPNGIEEHVAGIGNSLQAQISSAVHNYVFSIFEPISRSLAGTQHAHTQLSTPHNGNPVLWHVTIGSLALQGQWNAPPEKDFLFGQLKVLLPQALEQQPVNWLKLYVAKSADGTITTECSLNNSTWQPGCHALQAYADSWFVNGHFHGLKQFIVFRKAEEQQ